MWEPCGTYSNFCPLQRKEINPSHQGVIAYESDSLSVYVQKDIFKNQCGLSHNGLLFLLGSKFSPAEETGGLL